VGILLIFMSLTTKRATKLNLLLSKEDGVGFRKIAKAREWVDQVNTPCVESDPIAPTFAIPLTFRKSANTSSIHPTVDPRNVGVGTSTIPGSVSGRANLTKHMNRGMLATLPISIGAGMTNTQLGSDISEGANATATGLWAGSTAINPMGMAKGFTGRLFGGMGVGMAAHDVYAGHSAMNQMKNQYGSGDSQAYKDTQMYRDAKRRAGFGYGTLASAGVGAGIGAMVGGGVGAIPGAVIGATVGGIASGVNSAYQYGRNRFQGIDADKQSMYTHNALSPDQSLGTAEGFMGHLNTFSNMDPYTKGRMTDNRNEATQAVTQQIREQQAKIGQDSAMAQSTTTR
jgi:hypothetical protein